MTNKAETGTIFKFTIPYGMGTCYAKLIDFYQLSMYDGITIKVFDYFEDREIKDAEFFRGMPLFMNPIPIAKMPSVRGESAWKKLGVIKEDTDALIPIYKKYLHNGFGWATLEEYQSRQWYVRVDFREDVGPMDFAKVRHLEELFLRSTVTIEKRVAMQLLRQKGIDVKDFFTKNCPDDYWITDYNTQQFIPLYKTIPEVIRGKPLIKGYVPDEYLDFDFSSL